MKKIVLGSILITFLITSCRPSKEIVKSNPQVRINDEVVGHIKMGLIEYEIFDTVNTSKETAEMMIGMMRRSMESELVFNSTKSVDLIKENDQYIRRSLYDRSTKTVYEFLVKDSIQYYSEMNISEMMKEIETSDEDLKELSKMFKANENSNATIEILGFRCNEVIMMQPPDYSEINAIAYTTEKIPHLSEAMGPMSKYFTGAPIKTVMFVNGIKVTIGAKEYSENKSMKEYLNLEKSKFQKLSKEEFESMKGN